MRGDFGGNTKMEGPAAARLGGVWKAGAWAVNSVMNLLRGFISVATPQGAGLGSAGTGSASTGAARAVNSGMVSHKKSFRWQHHEVRIAWARSGWVRHGKARANVAG